MREGRKAAGRAQAAVGQLGADQPALHQGDAEAGDGRLDAEMGVREAEFGRAGHRAAGGGAPLIPGAGGEVVGDALANALTLIDGLAVIGGGLSGAAPLFMPRLIAEMNGTIAKYDGTRIPRLAQKAFDLSDPAQREQFLRGEAREITIPRSERTLTYDPLRRLGIGISRR